MPTNTNRTKAFTLIELLVVIAIIALLLAIVMPSLRIAKEHARRLICATHMKSIGQAIVLYAERENGKLPMNFYQQDPGKTTLMNRRNYSNPVATYFLGNYDASVHNSPSSVRMSSMLGRDAAGNEMVTNLGYLMSAGLLDNATEVVYCSSNKTDDYSYESYGGDADWPKGKGPDYPNNPYSIRVSYSYLPQARTKKHPDSTMSEFPDAAYKMSELNANRSIMLDLLNGENMSHRMGGYVGTNILYGGGSVVFRKDENNIIKNGGNLIDIGRAREWRSVIRALE